VIARSASPAPSFCAAATKSRPPLLLWPPSVRPISTPSRRSLSLHLAGGRRTTLILGVISGGIGALMAIWIAISLSSLNRGIRLASEHVAGGSAEILGASNQLTTASQALAEGSTQQAAALEETSVRSRRCRP